MNRAELRVDLVNIFPAAFDNFIATARTCYSSKGVVSTGDVTGPLAEPGEIEKRLERKRSLARSLFKAGHHTTLQHAHAQFALSGVSRQFLWSFLHAHPFYNSEQVSQRYVTVSAAHYRVPPRLQGAAEARFRAAVDRQMRDYVDLGELLRPVVEDEYYGRFRGRYGTKRADTDVVKRAQETARYVLPIATTAYLYHTVSVLTVFRYRRLCDQWDVPQETREVVEAMTRALLAAEPQFAELLEDPLALEDSPEFSILSGLGPVSEIDRSAAAALIAEFDADLAGHTSILADYGAQNTAMVARGVREALGLPASAMSDSDAVRHVLDPARNPLFGESLNLTTLSKVTRALFHARYVFRKVLSHAADSQDQRHRMTPASRPALARHYTGTPDYVTPVLIKRSEAALARYRESMEATYADIEALLADGVQSEDALYLLPNSVKIRFTESADLLNLRHKMAMRLCWNAQEEIWQASLDEALAITKVEPEIGRWLLPPCGLRRAAGSKPICPEGDRYCGVPVWRMERENYERVI